MLDGTCTFGNGEDGFCGFGTGQTMPITVNGQSQLRAMAVGTIIEGFGKFKDHEEGTYVTVAPLTRSVVSWVMSCCASWTGKNASH